MKRLAHLIAMVIGLALMLHNTPSWGGPPNPTGSDSNSNTAGGAGALELVVGGELGGHYNTAFGKEALSSFVIGAYNTAIGVHALVVNTTGNRNTASGTYTLSTNESGNDNTATGYQALNANIFGNFNTASGSGALTLNTNGGGNTATGANALFFNNAGNNNTATGALASFGNTHGDGNTATGVQALSANRIGSENTAAGYGALFSNDAGSRNTAVGRAALLQSTGNKNIGIGFQAGVNLTTGHNNIYVGNLGGAVESQTVRIGTAQTRTFIAGIANATVANAAAVIIDTTTGQLGISLSSARYKQDIAPMGTRSEKVLQLRPVTFAFRDDANAMTHYGLIAEEVAAVLPELVTRTAAGDVQTVKYHELIPMLLNELQKQRQELAELRALVAGQSAGQRTIAASSLFTQSETDEASR